LQKQGRDKEAQAIYNQVLRSKPSDIGLVAVASNNLLCLNGDQNIFDSKKRLKAATVDGLDSKLTSVQRGAIKRNEALLAMFTAQVEVCKTLVASLGDLEGEATHILAGVLARAGRVGEAVESLASQASPLNTLTAAQILLTAGEVRGAVEQLMSLPPSWLYRVGILSSTVTLYLALEDRLGAAKLLKDAVEWNKKNNASSKSGMAVVWRKTAEFHLKSGEARVAAESLEELQKLEPGLTTLAQLVTAYAKFNLEKALEVSKKLPPFSSSHVDVDALESGSFMGARQFKKTPRPGGEKTPKAGQAETEEGLLVKKKRNKKKKKRLPKNYSPDAEPDPERWLPKKERTGLKYMPGYRKPRKDKRKGEKFTGAQGTTPSQSETFDYSARMEKAKESAAKQASPEPSQPTPGPRAQASRPQNKPKKKGGKKRF